MCALCYRLTGVISYLRKIFTLNFSRLVYVDCVRACLVVYLIILKRFLSLSHWVCVCGGVMPVVLYVAIRAGTVSRRTHIIAAFVTLLITQSANSKQKRRAHARHDDLV